ncbi:hypothetical protein tpqmel_0309 [Candidatus Gastranaerophilus sp. (ex Termes propinquus)]|nr:hypothetical protein tpqmel_0309 [Candidatus Gastranaerophilus sp. (ex Termes propinquus)]
MGKIFLILSLFFVSLAAFAQGAQGVVEGAVQDSVLTTTSVEVFSEKGKSADKFGLKCTESGEVLVEPKYKKLIKIGDRAWLAQKNNKFGLIDKQGNYLVDAKYRFADRLFGRYAKLGNGRDFGLYDEAGHAVIKPEYSVIEPLGYGIFLTCKNYKYGVHNSEGEELLANVFDSIYMPERGVLHARYQGHWYELNEVTSRHIGLPEDIALAAGGSTIFTISNIVANPLATSGYSAVSATNYFLKVFSALSPSYEKTIDDLMYSQGADAVNILMNFSWIPKFPITYAQNYYNILKAPNTGPLSDIRDGLKTHIK